MLGLEHIFSYCASALVCQADSIKQTHDPFRKYNIQDQHSGIFNLNSNQQSLISVKKKKATKTNPPNFFHQLNENIGTLSIIPTFSHKQEIRDSRRSKDFTAQGTQHYFLQV